MEFDYDKSVSNAHLEAAGWGMDAFNHSNPFESHVIYVRDYRNDHIRLFTIKQADFDTIKLPLLIPLDTKLRQVNHIYESDIIQLSVYRVILSHKYKAPVAKYGYVRTVVETADGDRVRYIKTNLLSEKEVVKLWHRYQSIRSGQVKTSCSCGGKFHM